MRGQAAGTDARAETARARGGRRKAQAQRYWGPVGPRARREVFFSFWYSVASMGRPACRGEVGQALRAAGARKGRGRDCRGQRERRNAIKNTLLPVAGISPGKSVFFVVFYEIFLRISASRAASLPEACPFWGGAGPEACLFFRFLDQFFFAGLRWVKLDGCTAELPCFASIKGEFHVPFPAGQHGRQDLCV